MIDIHIHCENTTPIMLLNKHIHHLTYLLLGWAGGEHLSSILLQISIIRHTVTSCNQHVIRS